MAAAVALVVPVRIRSRAPGVRDLAAFLMTFPPSLPVSKATDVPVGLGMALPVAALAGDLLPWALAAGLVVVVAVLAERRVRSAREQAAAAGRQARLVLALHERDRQRLAKALHDGPVQDLLALNMEASVAAHLGGPLHETAGDVSGVVHDLRAVSEALRPPALVAFGLAAALTAHVDRFRDRHPSISVSLDLDDDDDLDPRTRLALFRIGQEALDNAALHGPPLRIDVDLSVSEAGAALTVRDDGAGYEVPEDVTAFAASGRYGVIGMQAQAQSVGAELRIESAPGRTVVHVAAPAAPPDWA